MKKIHYDKTYFMWQKKGGKYGAQQDLWMYQEFIKKSDKVLDFGCGGGYILEKLKCNEKFGIDINYYARLEAKRKGIKVFEYFEDLPRNTKFNVIISHHTLEHLGNPSETLKKFYFLLKKRGYLICVVPADDWRKQKSYNTKDINKHLFTWTPLLLANLFVYNGFTVKDVRMINRAWVPFSRFYYPYVPRHIYSFLSWVWSVITLSRQIRIVVTK